ncbi:small integral membrane protein 35 [Passerculus sandwichensis]
MSVQLRRGPLPAECRRLCPVRARGGCGCPGAGPRRSAARALRSVPAPCPLPTGGFPSFYNQELIPKRSSGLEFGDDQVELRTSGPGLEPSLAAGRQPCHQGTGDRQDVPSSSTDGAQQQLQAGITRAAPVAQDMDPRTGQEPVRVLGVVLGIGLALLILASFGYTFIRWYRRGHCQRPKQRWVHSSTRL